MKRTRWLSCLVLISACAHLGTGSSTDNERALLWDAAHRALAGAEFAQADSLFSQLVEAYPNTQEARESLFYKGAIFLDPRNPRWNPEPAESNLRRYLALDTLKDVSIHRRPEGQVLLELASQLNMPAEERVPGLQPETRVQVVREPVVVRAQSQRALSAEVERLKKEVADRDAQIRQQREELERIRKTLSGQRR